MKTLLDDFAPMVPQLCEMLGRMYSTIPQASALDLTRQVGLLVWALGPGWAVSDGCHGWGPCLCSRGVDLPR